MDKCLCCQDDVYCVLKLMMILLLSFLITEISSIFEIILLKKLYPSSSYCYYWTMTITSWNFANETTVQLDWQRKTEKHRKLSKPSLIVISLFFYYSLFSTPLDQLNSHEGPLESFFKSGCDWESLTLSFQKWYLNFLYPLMSLDAWEWFKCSKSVFEPFN